MDWGRAVDIYCERVGPGFWAEPVNAATNLAFLAAAWWGWRLARRRGEARADVALVAALAAVVGVGSFLFHTFATAWAGLADVIPIGVFCLVYLFAGLRRFFGLGPFRVLGLAVVGVALFWVTPANLPPELRGSAAYLPVLAALGATALALVVARHPARAPIAAAALAFAVSLGFRSADPLACPAWPLGTHFLWHVLNGCVFALLLDGLTRAPRRAP